LAFYGQPQLTNSGLLAFEGRAGGGAKHGVWTRDSGGSLSHVAFEGDPAPGIPGAFLGDPTTNSTPLMRKALNEFGEIALFSIISGAAVTSSDDHAIWLRNGAGSFTLVAREGDPAPGTPLGVTFTALMGSDSEPVSDVPSLNNAGQMLFSASLTGPGVDSSNDEGIWFWDGTTLNLVVRMGDSVAGFPGFIEEFPTLFT
jgi:hypothetical protein